MDCGGKGNITALEKQNKVKEYYIACADMVTDAQIVISSNRKIKQTENFGAL